MPQPEPTSLPPIADARCVGWRVLLELVAGGLALLGLAVAAWSLLDANGGVVALALVAYLGMATLLWGGLRRSPGDAPRSGNGLGPANRVTLARGVLVALLTGTLADPGLLTAQASWLFGVALIALLLDGVDGWLARRTGSASALGARFDMELDAAFILVLCLALLLLDRVGPWMLAIGAMRYVFVAASRPWPWLAAPLPESRRRKAVCVWQVAALMLALLPVATGLIATWLAATALAGLTLSFAVDVRWLYRHR